MDPAAVQAASLAEPELALVLEEGQRRHRDGTAGLACRLEALGALRAGVDAADASTTFAALSDFRLAIVLVDELGLDGNRLEDWIATTAARLSFLTSDCDLSSASKLRVRSPDRSICARALGTVIIPEKEQIDGSRAEDG